MAEKIRVADTPQSRIVIAMAAIGQCNGEGHPSKEAYWHRLGVILNERFGDGHGQHFARILRILIEEYDQ